jgi:hypothetical protein
MLKRVVLIGSLGLWSTGCSGGGSDSGETACADAPGVICTWAGSGELGYNGDGLALRDSDMYWPVGLTFADDDTAYVLDWQNHRVRRTTPEGTFETVIGTGFVGDGPENLTTRSAASIRRPASCSSRVVAVLASAATADPQPKRC